MTDEMKLLRAFIEASGFDVVNLPDYKYKKMKKSEAMLHNRDIGFTQTDYILVTESGSQGLLIDDDGNYTARLKKPIIDYKVTKKEVTCPGDLFSLGCQVANIDIRLKLDDMGFDLDKNQMHDLMETIIFHMRDR